MRKPIATKPRAARVAAPQTPITHADRVLFPEDGVTKGEVAAYYAAVAKRMAPHLDRRLASILRAPDGIGAETFFQRHPLKGMTRGIVATEAEGGLYMALDGAEGLRTAAQFGAIEIHGWLSRADNPGRPDRMILDLDPDPSVGFAEVKAAAKAIADALAEFGVKTWPLVTGGKGVHVVAPLDGTLASEAVGAFAHGFALGLARQFPRRFVAAMSKAARGGRIFIDRMRNQRAATAILPWSLRARPGAPVATPVDWNRLAGLQSAAAFTIRSAAAERAGWDGFFTTRQTIPAAALAVARRTRD